MTVSPAAIALCLVGGCWLLTFGIGLTQVLFALRWHSGSGVPRLRHGHRILWPSGRLVQLAGLRATVDSALTDLDLQPAPNVELFHETEPALWESIKGQMLALSRSCENGDIINVEEFARRVQAIRYLTNGHNPRLDALIRAIEAAPHRGISDVPTVLGHIFSRIAALAVELPQLFAQGLPILLQDRTCQVYLTRKQCATLLSAAFFGAVPGRSIQENADFARANRANVNDGRRLDMPSFDLGYLLEQEDEKMLCLLSYFAQVTEVGRVDLEEMVSFGRRTVRPLAESFWSELDKPLSPVHIKVDVGGIEDSEGNLQADFANRFLGGAVLHSSRVQEEIRFSICPECIVGMLFCESMLANEALFIIGTRQFSRYAGYGGSFKFIGPDLRERSAICDSLRRCGPHIVAFDALAHPGMEQYSNKLILRELLKVHAACLGDPSESDGPQQVGFATGNWGCGAHGGDPQLKALIQWLAASSAGRELIYFPFGDQRVEQLPDVIEAVRQSGARCKHLYKMLHGHQAGGDVFARVLDLASKRSKARDWLQAANEGPLVNYE